MRKIELNIKNLDSIHDSLPTIGHRNKDKNYAALDDLEALSCTNKKSISPKKNLIPMNSLINSNNNDHNKCPELNMHKVQSENNRSMDYQTLASSHKTTAKKT